MRGISVATAIALAMTAASPVLAAPKRETLPGDHMVRAGVGVLVAGIVAYGLLGAGLGIGAAAEQDISSRQRAEDQASRRDLIARGQVGNRLAIAGGVLAAVSMAVGIPLVVVGRRRHERAMASLSAAPIAGGGGLTLRIRW